MAKLKQYFFGLHRSCAKPSSIANQGFTVSTPIPRPRVGKAFRAAVGDTVRDTGPSRGCCRPKAAA